MQALLAAIVICQAGMSVAQTVGIPGPLRRTLTFGGADVQPSRSFSASVEGSDLVRVLALLAAAVPFAFGLIRLAQTGSDARYLVVAAAALCGAVVAMKVARTAKAGAAFLASTLFAVVAALILGTRLGPGILVVAAAFGFCFALAAELHIRARG